MKAKNIDLSKYHDSELVPVSKTSTKLEILTQYLKDKEQKAKSIAETAGVTSVVSGFMTPFVAAAIGLGYATQPDAFTTPSVVTAAAFTTLGLTTSIVSHIISKKQKAKRREYKELKEFAQAGKRDALIFEKVKTAMQDNLENEATTQNNTTETTAPSEEYDFIRVKEEMCN